MDLGFVVELQACDARIPHGADSLHLGSESLACDVGGLASGVHCLKWSPRVWSVKGIHQQGNVGGLDGLESRLQIGITKTKHGGQVSGLRIWHGLGRWASHHVNCDDEFDSSVGEPAVGGKAFIDGMQKT